jgi:hypothetical protein
VSAGDISPALVADTGSSSLRLTMFGDDEVRAALGDAAALAPLHVPPALTVRVPDPSYVRSVNRMRRMY